MTDDIEAPPQLDMKRINNKRESQGELTREEHPSKEMKLNDSKVSSPSPLPTIPIVTLLQKKQCKLMYGTITYSCQMENNLPGDRHHPQQDGYYIGSSSSNTADTINYIPMNKNHFSLVGAVLDGHGRLGHKVTEYCISYMNSMVNDLKQYGISSGSTSILDTGVRRVMLKIPIFMAKSTPTSMLFDKVSSSSTREEYIRNKRARDSGGIVTDRDDAFINSGACMIACFYHQYIENSNTNNNNNNNTTTTTTTTSDVSFSQMKRKLWVMNIGDCRAVYINKESGNPIRCWKGNPDENEYYRSTIDHDMSNSTVVQMKQSGDVSDSISKDKLEGHTIDWLERELFEIEDRGGSVVLKGQTLRVDGVLEPTRSVGNLALHISHKPDIYAIDVDLEPPGYLVSATDGLWKVFTVTEVGQFLTRPKEMFTSHYNEWMEENLTPKGRWKSIDLACKMLVASARERKCSDDITVQIIVLGSFIKKKSV